MVLPTMETQIIAKKENMPRQPGLVPDYDESQPIMWVARDSRSAASLDFRIVGLNHPTATHRN